MQKAKRITLGWSALVLIGLILGLTSISAAETAAIWGDLEPGPHGIGFRTLEQYDHSRSFRPEKDYFGATLEGETARPIQISLWYPAVIEDPFPMVYAEYSFPYPNNGDFVPLLGGLQNRDLGVLFFMLGNSQPLVQGAMDIEMGAVRDADAAEGDFPLIIYHGGARGGYSENAVLCEYLASHGYVVATAHTMGTWQVAATEEPADFETVVRDKEFILQAIKELPGIDLGRMGLLGYGFGSATAIVNQMRSAGNDAIVTIHGSFLNTTGAEALLGHGSFVPERMLVPWLNLYAPGPEQVIERAIMDSLKYCERREIVVEDATAGDLGSYRLIASMLTPDSLLPPGGGRAAHDLVCRTVRGFFDSELKDAATELPGSALAAEPVPPTPLQFGEIVGTNGIATAKELAETFDLFNPENPVMPGQAITNLGYQFLQRGQIDDALVIFEWGVTAFPDAANAWDSFGEARAANSDFAGAIECYQKALELVPSDETLPPGFRQMLEMNIPQIIEDLQQQLSGESSDEG